MPLNLTWVDLAFSGTKGYPGQAKRHSLPFQEEAVLKYLVVPLTFALDCTYCHTATRPLLRRLVARRRAVAVDWTPICATFLPRTGTSPCRSDRLTTIDAPFHRRMKLPSPLAHTAQSLPVTMLPTKNSLKSFKSVLARSDWPSVLFGSPVCTLGFDIRVRLSITGGAGLCSVSTSSHSVVSSWDRCLSVISLWGVIERCEPRLRPVFS